MARPFHTKASFIAVLAGLLLAGVPALALEKTVLMLGWVPNGPSVGYYVAVDQGFYRAQGIEMEVVRGFGAGETAKRVATGVAPFGDADTGALIVGRSKDLWKTKVVAMLFQTGALAYYTMKDSGIRVPKDFVGRKIGEPPGGAMRALFPALAEANGFDMNKVIFVSMDAAATIPSLLAGKVDAIGLYTTTAPVLIQAAKKQGKEVHGVVFADHGIQIYGNSVQVLDKLMAEKPALVRGVVHASMQGYHWALQKPKETVDIFSRYNPTADREITALQFETFQKHLVSPVAREKGLGFTDEKTMEYSRDLIIKYFKLETKPPVQDLYTNEFLPGLKP